MPQDRILVVLQFWEGDQLQALDLTQLILEMQPEPTKSWELVLLARADCPLHQKIEHLVAIARPKVPMTVVRGQSQKRGHPDGCYGLWLDAMRYGHYQPGFRGILTIEADCLPTSPTWIDQLTTAYINQAKPILGHVMPHVSGKHSPHVNGNAIFPTWLYAQKDIHTVPEGAAWDNYLGPTLAEMSFDCPLIVNAHRTPSTTTEQLKAISRQGVPPALIHGIRDDSGRRIIRQRYVLKQGS